MMCPYQRPFVVAVMLIAIIGFTVRAGETHQPHIGVKVDVSSARVDIAEPFEVAVTVNYPADLKIRPPPTTGYLGDVRVLEYADTESRTGDTKVWKRVLRCEAYEPGRQPIPPFELTFQEIEKPEDESEPVRQATPAAQIDVRSALGLLEFSPQLHPITGRVFVPWGTREWFIACCSTAALIGLGYLARRMLWRWFPSDEFSHAALVRQLQRLRARWLSGAVSDREAVLGYADLLRRWFQLIDGIEVRHRTTQEWQVWLSEHREFSSESRIQAASLLAKADGVKFAGGDVNLDDARGCFEGVEFILTRDRRLASSPQKVTVGTSS